MKVYQHFRYTGKEQRWTVPAGVTQARFECWGAGGGVASWLHYAGKTKQVVGGSAPANTGFYNSPHNEGDLGVSFSNGSGYAAGDWPVNPGETYHLYVGGNGKPGYSSIRLNKDGSYTVSLRGGAGGYNGGGDGGKGAHVHQNLWNSSSTTHHYSRDSMPAAATVGQIWYDTDAHEAKKCNTTYKAGHADSKFWDVITHKHTHAVGPSGGGGGGATDIRYGGTDLSNRILIAGGSGGSAGHPIYTGPAAWAFHQVPSTPKPPFGNDTVETGHSGVDTTWATGTTYFSTGWGHGGMGGGTGPQPSHVPTLTQGRVSVGEAGGAASGRHNVDSTEVVRHGAGGGGGTALVGGYAGAGGTGQTAGALGVGGDGADAPGGYDDWCAGGGGGGGGYYGGGGGGIGFRNSGHTTDGGGGGGGSNFAHAGFTNFVLAGGARPPMGYSGSGTGNDGHGGFCRISYNRPPTVKFKTIPNSALGGSVVNATFTFAPAVTDGAGIDYYTVGSSTNKNATVPDTTQTVMVPKPTTTEFTTTFVAPAAGVAAAYFVQVTDVDGDSSSWVKHIITGLTATQTSLPTITSPAANGQFVGSVTMTWTLGNQTPLVAYRTGLTGLDPVTKKTVTVRTPWHRGGSRVNLAPDPGFHNQQVWGSTSNVKLQPSTTYPGISGQSGVIQWHGVQDGSAEQHTVTFDTLQAGYGYHLHLELASNTPYDPRLYQLQVWDKNGLIQAETVSLAALPAGTYLPVDLHFTPHTQGVYFVLVPSDTAIAEDVDPLMDLDFEDGTAEGFSAGYNDATSNAVSGVSSLRLNAATATKDVTAFLKGAGTYLARGWLFRNAASSLCTMAVSGSGVTGTAPGGPVPQPVATNLMPHPYWSATGDAAVGPQAGAANTTYWTAYCAAGAWNQLGPGTVSSGRTPVRMTAISPNLIPTASDPGFESGMGMWAGATPVGGGTLAWDSTHHHGGTHSLSYTCTAATGNYTVQVGSFVPSSYGFANGDSFTFGVWVYVPTGVDLYGSNDYIIGAYGGAMDSANYISAVGIPRDQWVYVSQTAVFTNVASTVAFRIFGGLGTYYLDDIVFQKAQVTGTRLSVRTRSGSTGGPSIPAGTTFWFAVDVLIDPTAIDSTGTTTTPVNCGIIARDDPNNDSSAVTWDPTYTHATYTRNATVQRLWWRGTVNPGRTVTGIYVTGITAGASMTQPDGAYIELGRWQASVVQPGETQPPAYFDGASGLAAPYSAMWSGVAEQSPSLTVIGAPSNEWDWVQVPFVWDGTGSVTLTLTGDATAAHGVWWDDVQVCQADLSQANFGNVDSGVNTYLANMLLELSTAEDADLGYRPWFGGSNANGQTGTVGWLGATNNSPSYLTGTDVLTGTSPTYAEKRLTSAHVFLDTLSEAGIYNGFDGAEATQNVNVNPSVPPASTVTLQVNQQTGLMTLSINANDTASITKTVSFDIFRNGVRIATGLTPDVVTRAATYIDAPDTGVLTTYVVRALDAKGGYTDTTDGTVNVVA